MSQWFTTATSATTTQFYIVGGGSASGNVVVPQPYVYPPLWIRVEDGEVFEGSEEDWQQTFFENASASEIAAFCDENGWSHEITPR
jgi:hypothetical protein